MGEPEERRTAGEPATPPLSDTPIPDRLWDGMVAWMSGTFVVFATAIAISTTLGWPRRAAAELTGSQLGFLISQAVVCCAFVLRSGRRVCRRYPGAVAVAFTAGVPASLALLMALEWRDAQEPMTTWTRLFLNSGRLAALEAAPVGYLLWILTQRGLRWGGAGETSEVG